MAKEKHYTKNDLWDQGTRVKALDTSEYAHWNKYPMAVVAFRWREDGGIDYRVRAWRIHGARLADRPVPDGQRVALSHRPVR